MSIRRVVAVAVLAGCGGPQPGDCAPGLAAEVELASADTTYTSPGNDDRRMGSTVALPGDATGDGSADLVFIDPIGVVTYVIDAPACGVERADRAAAARIVGENYDEWFPEAASGLGDLDGDGAADVAVAVKANGTYPERLYVWSAPSGTVDVADAPLVIVGPAATFLTFDGMGLVAAGDATGDDLDDALLAYAGVDGDIGAVLLRGPLEPGELRSADAPVKFRAYADTASAGTAGDLSGDGVSDVILPTAGRGALVWHGPFGGGTYVDNDADAQFELDAAEVDLASGAWEAYRLGDLDGDGATDLLVPTPFPDVGSGAVIWDAADEGAPIATLACGAGVCASQRFEVGDIDGDGIADVVTSAVSGDRPFAEQTAQVWHGPFDGAVDLGGAPDVAFVDPENEAGPVGPTSAVGDLDGDGAAELVFADVWTRGGQVHVFLGGS